MKPVLLLFLFLAIPTAALADGIGNGDFDGGISDPPTLPWEPSGFVLIVSADDDPGNNSQVVQLGPDPERKSLSLSQSFSCGDDDDAQGVCTVTFWVQWLPSTKDPGEDERLQILDVADRSTVFFRSFDEPLPSWTPVTASFGACGSQKITIRILDGDKDSGIDSLARVDFFSCTCEQPVPTFPTTWGTIKARYEP